MRMFCEYCIMSVINQYITAFAGVKSWECQYESEYFELVNLTYEANKCAFVDENQLLIDEKGNFRYRCKTFNYNQYCISHLEELDQMGHPVYRPVVQVCLEKISGDPIQQDILPALYLLSGRQYTIFLAIIIAL